MTACIKAHAENGIARLYEGLENALIGLAARIGLDVGKTAIKERFGAVSRKLFNNIDIFAAAIIAPPRIPFGVFIGQDGALGFEHRARDNVL